jgi:hypothetical protein
MNEFKWGFSLLEMENKFNEIYESGKRIQMHVNYDEDLDSFVLYYGSYENPSKLKITENFINSIRTQIETSIKNGFSDFVFFPDMGHSHLYFKNDYWQKNYINKFETKNIYKQYEAMFKDPELYVLYHLTEQLQMLDEDKKPINDLLEFKYLNRNFMARNDESDFFEIKHFDEPGKYNTVGEVEGFTRWGQGFSVSASKNGCFPYIDKNGETRYFDIGIADPRQDPNTPVSLDSN